MLSTLVNELANLLFPTHCVGCETPATYCCDTCLQKLPDAPASPDRTILALFDYRDRRVKRLIWLLKYRGGRAVAKILADALYDRVLDEVVEIEMFQPTGDPWLLIPIPLSPQKRRHRGFNQTEEIAKHLLRRNSRNFERGQSKGLASFDLLKRVRDERSQMSIKERAERWANIEDAFQVTDSQAVAGRHILLIDDVTTTGATLSEARRVLHAAGARQVFAVAVAHG